MVQTPITPPTLYPDSDGKLMFDNTEQYDWIVRLVGNLKYLLRNQDAFVAGDLLWYPVEVAPDETPPSQAPDAMVAFGRPQGRRGSYKQWEEGNIAPQVVFEILSPSNTRKEMGEKQDFYARYGVLEMYYYDPQRRDFWGFVRQTPQESCTIITSLYLPWVSPLLQIRFELFEDGLSVYHPDGTPFKDPETFALGEEQAKAEREQEKLRRQQTQEELAATQTERDELKAERDGMVAERERLQAKLRELGIDPKML